MARLPLVDIEKVTDPEILGIFAWVTEMEGKVPNHFAVELNFPELMKSKLGFTKILWETGELSMEEIQHVGIVVSRANGCQYCTGAVCTILVHDLGEDKSKAEELVSKGASALVSKSRLKLITEFAELFKRFPYTRGVRLRSCQLEVIHVDIECCTRLRLVVRTLDTRQWEEIYTLK